MSPLFRRREKALTASSTVVQAISEGALNTYVRLGGGVNQQINAAFLAAQSSTYAFMYRTQPSVRRVVDYVALNAAQLGLKLYRRVDNEDRQEVGEHPAAQSVRYPNTFTPGKQFILNLFSDYLVHDNAYAVKVRGTSGDSPIAMLQIPPPAVVPLGSARFTPVSYRIFTSDGQYFDVPPEDMIHWCGYNPDDPRIGVSKLETLRQQLAQESATQSATVELMKNGLVKPGMILRPLEAPLLSEEARQRFEESWANRAKASKRRTPLLEEGMTFDEGAITPKDAEMLNSREFTRSEVAAAYGMASCPPENQEDREQFYADVLPPVTETFAAWLNHGLVQAEYGSTDLYFEFDMDEKLMGNERLTALVSASGGPVLLRDEARAMLNLPKVDGGDELITPLNVIVGENPKPSPMVMPIQDPNKPPQDGSYREQQAITGNGKATHLLPRRAALEGRRNGYGKTLEGILKRHFARQERVTKSKGMGAKALDDERWNAELATDLRREYGPILLTEGEIASARMASEWDNARVQHYLAAKSRGEAENINAYTAKELRDRDLSDVFDEARNQRAPANGMAMATGIVAFATREAIAQTGQKRMVSVSGGECPVCDPYQGTWAVEELDAWPPYHPSCNCLADVAA